MSWCPDEVQVMSREEVRALMRSSRKAARHADDLIRRRRHQVLNVILSLGSGCGLRVSEMANLDMKDMILVGSRPHVHVRNGKGGKSRRVPIWNPRAHVYFRNWQKIRLSEGAGQDDPFLRGIRDGSMNRRLDRFRIYNWFRTLTREVLGRGRNIHCLRHFFVSYALSGNKADIVSVQKAAGHSSLFTTNLYAHIMPDGKRIKVVI